MCCRRRIAQLLFTAVLFTLTLILPIWLRDPHATTLRIAATFAPPLLVTLYLFLLGGLLGYR